MQVLEPLMLFLFRFSLRYECPWLARGGVGVELGLFELGSGLGWFAAREREVETASI